MNNIYKSKIKKLLNIWWLTISNSYKLEILKKYFNEFEDDTILLEKHLNMELSLFDLEQIFNRYIDDELIISFNNNMLKMFFGNENQKLFHNFLSQNKIDNDIYQIKNIYNFLKKNEKINN